MAQNQIDLAGLFNAASAALAQNQGALNQADTYNQNHGDSMVQIFDLINQAIAEKPKASASAQLAHASDVVRANSSSGSAAMYSGALQSASEQFKGQTLNQDNAMQLITTLLSGGQAPQPAVTQQGTDLLSGLLGALTGDSAPQASSGTSQGGAAIDAQDLLRGGMAYMEAQQHGASGTEALMDAIIAGSPLGESPQRTQSAKVIGGAILSAVTAYVATNKAKSSGSASQPAKSSGSSRQAVPSSSGKSTGIKRKARP
jgi:hypothetical protein